MRCWPRFTTVTTPTFRRTPKCLETAGCGSRTMFTTSLTERSLPSTRTPIISRRRGSVRSCEMRPRRFSSARSGALLLGGSDFPSVVQHIEFCGESPTSPEAQIPVARMHAWRFVSAWRAATHSSQELRVRGEHARVSIGLTGAVSARKRPSIRNTRQF